MKLPPIRGSQRRACVAAVVLLLAAATPVLGAPLRGRLTLDDGRTSVVVDSEAHGWPVPHLVNLVLAADRSTKDDGMWVRPTKGLFRQDDRVFITYKYLAWLGQGTLRGLWTLDPETRNFRHYRVGPEGHAWAHNELVSGSASPGGETYHWDVHAPGVEHAMAFEIAPGRFLSLSHQGGLFAEHGRFQPLFDGLPLAEGVVYASATRMAVPLGGRWVVDVSDGNDANGVGNWVDSQQAFIMRPDDIRVIWRFAPARAAVQPYNTYYWIWANYSTDQDGLPCDVSPADDWPSAPWGAPGHVASNVDTWDGFVEASRLPADPEAAVPLRRGTPCTTENPGHYTYRAPEHGTWVRWGETASLAPGTPRWTLTHIEDPFWGLPVRWDYFGVAHEDSDAVWGAGGQLFGRPLWLPGVWRTTSYVLSTQ